MKVYYTQAYYKQKITNKQFLKENTTLKNRIVWTQYKDETKTKINSKTSKFILNTVKPV